MGLESATYINDLNTSNPTGSDLGKDGDNHMRLIKSVLKATLPNASRAFYFPTTATKTTNYTVLTTEENAVIIADGSSATVQITLPGASLGAGNAGWRVSVFASDVSNAVTVVPGTGTINGEATISLSKQYQFETFFWTGTAFIKEGATLGSLAYLSAVADASITTAKIADNAVTLAKLATQASGTILGNISGSAAVPSALGVGDFTEVTPAAADVLTFFDASDSNNIKKHTIRELVGLFSVPHVIVEHQESDGTDGGATAATAWTNRPLTTIVRDEASIASITGTGDARRPQLPAGTYYAEFEGAFYFTDYVSVRIVNGAGTALNAESAGAIYVADSSNDAWAKGWAVFTFGSTDTVQLQYYASSARPTNGLGTGAGLGQDEIFARLRLWKID